jgi:hypothetical protein
VGKLIISTAMTVDGLADVSDWTAFDTGVVLLRYEATQSG